MHIDSFVHAYSLFILYGDSIAQ